MTPHVLYIGAFAMRTGYAQAAHDYALALHRTGTSLEIQPVAQCNTEDLDARYAELLPLVRGYPNHERKPPTHVIVHTVPAHAHRFLEGIPDDVYRIAMTTWETNKMPREFSNRLDDNFDMVIVPSGFCAEAVSCEGLRTLRMEIVPHCFDPKHWPTAPESLLGGTYSFYSVLGWSERKNPIGLLKAYLSEFTSEDDVILRLKLSGFCGEDMTALAQATGIPPDELPEVDIITDYFDHDEMVWFHRDNDCFVTAARGEGWNLPAFEAALLGNPVISPRWGGQMEYLNDYSNFFPISVQLTPAITPLQSGELIEGTHIRVVNKVQPSGITARQRWAEPDLDELGKTMRACYERRASIDGSSREELEKRYGYDTIGSILAELVETHARL